MELGSSFKSTLALNLNENEALGSFRLFKPLNAFKNLASEH